MTLNSHGDDLHLWSSWSVAGFTGIQDYGLVIIHMCLELETGFCMVSTVLFVFYNVSDCNNKINIINVNNLHF